MQFCDSIEVNFENFSIDELLCVIFQWPMRRTGQDAYKIIYLHSNLTVYQSKMR